MSDSIEVLDNATLRVADAIGGLMEFWGFRRAMGRMWALLYLAPQPLTALELGERLRMSTGAVSMTLTELTKWGVVKKSWRPGDRKDYFEPETSIWKMVTRVFRERELVQIREAIATFEAVLSALAGAAQRSRSEDKRRIKFAGERVESLLALARAGDTLLGTILEGRRVDPTPFIRLFSGAGDKT